MYPSKHGVGLQGLVELGSAGLPGMDPPFIVLDEGTSYLGPSGTRGARQVVANLHALERRAETPA
ncbi:MAG: hypothetical protein QME92_01230 [Bacillota bacterium]|nr:hypothetical protein [Bacillota bacterium]